MVKIAQSKIRGVVSNGMLCSEEELGPKESEGILILPPRPRSDGRWLKSWAVIDTTLTFKLTANRGDCLSHCGMAREVGAALGSRSPSLRPGSHFADKASYRSVHLEAGESAAEFLGCAIDGVKIGPSPEWLVKRLETWDRSINNVVDATNLVMLGAWSSGPCLRCRHILGKRNRR